MLFFVWILGGSFFLLEMKFFSIKGLNFAHIFFENLRLRISKITYFIPFYVQEIQRNCGQFP